MNSNEMIILILFYLCSGLSVASGIYLLSLNINTRLHKIAFLFCFSLACWCFGAARTLQATDVSIALQWRRFAVVGSTLFYAFFIHFLIILTNNKTFQKTRMLFVIYGPIFVLDYFCALNGKIANHLYEFRKLDIGWGSGIISKPWHATFELYIVCYFLFGLYLVLQWKKDKTTIKDQREFRLIFYTYLIFLLLAAIVQMSTRSSVSASSYVRVILPIIVTLPIISILLSSKRYGFMKKNKRFEDPLYMDQFRTKIIRVTEVFFALAGIIFYILQIYVMKNSARLSVTFFSMLLVGFGFLIFCIEKFVKSKECRIMGYAIVLSVSIPIIMLHFVTSYAITVWSFPFIILIASLLFYNTTILTLVATSTITSLIMIWIVKGTGEVNINSSDYVGRLLIMGIAIGCVYYINQIYILRLRQLSEKMKAQDFLFQVSSSMIHIKDENEREKINEILTLLQNFSNADQIYIHIQSIREKSDFESFYQFSDGTIQKMSDSFLQKTHGTVWWQKQLIEKDLVIIEDTKQLGEDATIVQNALMEENVVSLIEVPLKNENMPIGFLRLDFNRLQTLDDEFIKTLKILGNLLGETNYKISVERQMDQIVHYDPLTNMPNRTMFGQQIDKEIKVAQIKDEMFSIVFLDLDFFKLINDSNGHHFGDKIIVMVAERLQKCFRKTDVLCRFGGDEFLILLNHMSSKQDVETVIKKIIQSFDEPYLVDEQEFKITASIGVSIFPDDGMDRDALIKNADLAMYQAKSKGRNQYVFCSDEMKEELKQNVLLVNYLYHAIARNELEVHYQPQIDIKTNQICGMEALVRWNHAQLGAISPATFIPIAEKTGMINEIGYWILKNSCMQNKIWQDMGFPPLRLAVNVSVNQLLNNNFATEVKEILDETGLDAKWLELEITESIAIQESEYMVLILKQLKHLGVTLAIDDFGMEYSSLNRIKQLPIDRIKIDMHFVRNLFESEKDKAIVDVIIKLAKSLNFKIVAEGVEDERQLEYLKDKNCDEIQGFYYYKPLTKFEFEEVLQDKK